MQFDAETWAAIDLTRPVPSPYRYRARPRVPTIYRRTYGRFRLLAHVIDRGNSVADRQRLTKYGSDASDPERVRVELLRSISAITGIPQSRNYERIFVKRIVDRCCPDWHIGMNPAHAFDTRRCAD